MADDAGVSLPSRAGGAGAAVGRGGKNGGGMPGQVPGEHGVRTARAFDNEVVEPGIGGQPEDAVLGRRRVAALGPVTSDSLWPNARDHMAA